MLKTNRTRENQKSVLNNRKFDYAFDPAHKLSGVKDYQKARERACSKNHGSMVNFDHAFSEIPGLYPATHLVENRSATFNGTGLPALSGAEIHKYKQHKTSVANTNVPYEAKQYQHYFSKPRGEKNFFKQPGIKLDTRDQAAEIANSSGVKSLDRNEANIEYEMVDGLEVRSIQTQTEFRESYAQTVPFSPPFEILEGNPEVLELLFKEFKTFNDDDKKEFLDRLNVTFADIALLERSRERNRLKRLLEKCPEDDFKLRKRLMENLERLEIQFKEEDMNKVVEMGKEKARKELYAEMESLRAKNRKRCKHMREQRRKHVDACLEKVDMALARQLKQTNNVCEQSTAGFTKISTSVSTGTSDMEETDSTFAVGLNDEELPSLLRFIDNNSKRDGDVIKNPCKYASEVLNREEISGFAYRKLREHEDKLEFLASELGISK